MNRKRSRSSRSASPPVNRLVKWSVFSAVVLTTVVSAGLSLSGCNGGKSGPLSGNPTGGNTGGSGPSVVNNFTVSPSQAAPGALVKLQGVRLNSSDVVTVKFGDQETLIHGRNSDNAEVYVPLFLNAANQHVAPAAPVTVSVQIANGTATPATNKFTVQALPAAPGTAQVTVQRMNRVATFLDNFSEGVLLSLAQQNPPALSPVVANHGIALAQAMKFLTSDPSNPDSLQAIVNGTAPAWEGSKLPPQLIDSMLAQSNTLQEVNEVSLGLFTIIQRVAPELLQGNATNNLQARGSVSSKIIVPSDGGAENASQAIAIISKDKYKILPNAKKIVLAIEFQRFLVSYEEGLAGSALFGATAEKFVEIVGMVADKVKGGIIGGGAKAIVTLYASAKITSQFARAYAGFMPNGVSEFYVRLAGTQRKEGDPPYKMQKDQVVGLDFYAVTQWGGRKIIDAGDVQSAFDAAARKAGLDKVFEKYKVPKKKQEEIIKFLFDRSVILINSAYELKTGQSSPWLAESGDLTAPPGKNPELKLNDVDADVEKLRVVTVTTQSTNVLKVLNTDANKPNFYRLQASSRGCNVGIRTEIQYLPLATIVREGGSAQAFVRTSIDVTNPDGSCPQPGDCSNGSRPDPNFMKAPGCNGCGTSGPQCPVPPQFPGSPPHWWRYNCETGECESFAPK